MGYPSRKKVAFVVTSTDSLTISNDASAPSYLGTGATDLTVEITGASQDLFELVTASNGTQWIKNKSGRTLSMFGSVMFQNDATVGGTSDLRTFSDVSDDNGETPIINYGSLRVAEISNNEASAEFFPSGIDGWKNNQCLRFGFYNAGGGTIDLDLLSDTIRGVESVVGYSFAWELREL